MPHDRATVSVLALFDTAADAWGEYRCDADVHMRLVDLGPLEAAATAQAVDTAIHEQIAAWTVRTSDQRGLIGGPRVVLDRLLDRHGPAIFDAVSVRTLLRFHRRLAERLLDDALAHDRLGRQTAAVLSARFAGTLPQLLDVVAADFAPA